MSYNSVNFWNDRAKKQGRKFVGTAGIRLEDQADKFWEGIQKIVTPDQLAGKRVLDYGCGIGRFVPYLSHLARMEYFGVDVVPSALDIAREEHRDASFALLTTPENLPQKRFDVLWACTVLMHLPDHELGLVKDVCDHALAPGASFLVIDTNQERANIHVFPRGAQRLCEIFDLSLVAETFLDVEFPASHVAFRALRNG